MADHPDGEQRRYGFRTRAVHAGARPDPTTGARAVPIYQTSSFVFESVDEAASLFALQSYGNIYSRIANPTVAAFEERMASLEGGLGAVATSSGQAAELLTFAALAGSGDHIVSSARLYGGTRTLLDTTLRRFGVDTSFVASDDPADYAKVIGPHTKAVYAEVIALTVCHLSSMPRSPRRTSAGRSNTAPTSSSTRPPSSSAGTAPRSAV